MGAAHSHRGPSSHHHHRSRHRSSSSSYQHHPTYRSWQELQQDELGNYQFMYSPSPADLEEELTYAYSSCKYKTPPVSLKFMDRLPTLKLEHDASHLLQMMYPSSSCCSSSTTTVTKEPSSSCSSDRTSTSTGSSCSSSTCCGGGAGSSSSARSSADDDECLICFASYTRGSTLVSLPCGHSYHKDCIQEWFHRQCSCPYCRYEFPTDSPDYEKGRRERMSFRSLPLATNKNNNSKNNTQRPMFLVDVLKERQEKLKHLQHRRTVLDQLSFSLRLSSSPSSGNTAPLSKHEDDDDSIIPFGTTMPPPGALAIEVA